MLAPGRVGLRLWMILLLGCGFGLGCSRGETPEQVFARFQSSMQAKDYRTAFECYTPESQERALGMMLNQVARFKSTQIPQLQTFISRMASFGVPVDTLVPGNGPAAAASVADKVGCLAAFIEEFDKLAQSNPLLKSFPNPFEAIASAQLANVQINGETASGSVTLTLNGTPRTQGINFRKASGNWRMEELGSGGAASMASAPTTSPGLPRSAAAAGVAPFDLASGGAPAAGPAMADPAMMPAVGTAGAAPAIDPLNDPAMAATVPGAVPAGGPLGTPVPGTPGAAIPADPAMAAAIPAGAPGAIPAGTPGAIPAGPAGPGAAADPAMAAAIPAGVPGSGAIPAGPAAAGAAIPAGVGALPGAPGAPAAGDPAMAAAGLPGAEGAAGSEGGGNAPPQFPEGSVEYVVQKVVLAIINEKPEGLEDVISERAKGVLLSLRDGSIEAEKLTELKDQFNQVTLLSAKNSGTTRTIVLRGGEGHVMTFTVGKEKDANVVKDLKVQESRRTR